MSCSFSPEKVDRQASALPLSAILGLDEGSLAEVLVWAQRRAAELLPSIDDHELLRLLDPPSIDDVSAIRTRPEILPKLRLVKSDSAVQPSAAPVPPPPEYASDRPVPDTVIGPVPVPSVTMRPHAVYERPHAANHNPTGSRSGDERPTRVAAILEAIVDERYPEAVERLESLLHGRSERYLRVLLSVVRARAAIVEHDLVEARRCYETALRLEPGDPLVQRDLATLSALGG